MKNILIVILTLACAALSYLQFGPDANMPHVPSPNDPPEMTLPPVSAEWKDLPKRAATETILNAPVEGISLSTPLDEVSELLEVAGYDCTKSGMTKETSDRASQSANWRCAHRNLARTKMNISARNGEVITIDRTGALESEKIDLVLDKIEEMKAQLNTHDNLYFTQTPVKTDFVIRNGGDQAANTQMHYTLIVREGDTGAGPDDEATETTAQYRVRISR